MKKAIVITFLLIGQFAISQNDENINSDNRSTLSTNQKSDSPFQGKINRKVTKREGADFDESRLQRRTETSESRLVYKDSSAIMSKNINRNISKKMSSSEKEKFEEDSRTHDRSSSIENKNTGMKISRRRTSVGRVID